MLNNVRPCAQGRCGGWRRPDGLFSFLGFGHVGVELGQDFGLHRLNGFQAFFDGSEQVVAPPAVLRRKEAFEFDLALRA